VLESGQVGIYRWAVKVKRPASRTSTGLGAERHPCLLVGTKKQVGRFNFSAGRYRDCVDSADELTATSAPLIASGTAPSHGRARTPTAVGMIVAPAVHTIRVTLADGSRMSIRPLRLTPAQARRAGLRRFRYAAFFVRGLWCPRQLVSRSAPGTTLWDSGADDSVAAGSACSAAAALDR
jgi:hypothetical protein